MQRVDELDLPYLTMEDYAFSEDPVPHFAAARERHPWLANSAAGYVINDYKAIRELARMEDKFGNGFDGMVALMEAQDTAWGRFQSEHILNQSGEAHRRLRDMLAPYFTPRQANRHRPLMRKVISELLDEWAPKGAFDFEEFASYFPITVMCSLIGASPDEIPPLRSSLEALGLSASLDRSYLPALENAVVVMQEFVERLVAERRAGKRPSDETDLLDLLIGAQAGGGLTDDELYNLLIFLFVAGYDTSKNILTLIMHEMARHPAMFERCARDLDYCKKVTEETFRFHSTASTFRVLNEDIVYRDILFPKGSMIYLPVNIIGRDPRATSDAERFDPERTQVNPPLPFGLGAHICLGQFIARAQIEEGLHLIAQRLTHLRSPGPKGWRPYIGVWGIRGLPVEFEPAEASEQEPSLA